MTSPGEQSSDPDGHDSPLDHVAELFVYAPLGLALEARRLWPELVDRGRGQVNLARATGRRALGRYRDDLERRLLDTWHEAEAAARGLGLAPGSPHRSPSELDEQAPGGAESEQVSRAPAAEQSGRGAPVSDEPAIDVETLAIPDYDSLSASQVVPRLTGLEADELELVRRYEAGKRGRKTILNKIAQLQSG